MKTATKEFKTNTSLNVSMSYEEIAQKLGITVKEVKEAEASAIKKLRHPRIGKKLKTYIGF